MSDEMSTDFAWGMRRPAKALPFCSGMGLNRAFAATEVCPLSLWERAGVRGDGLSLEQRPLTRIALDDASHRQKQSDLSPQGRGEVKSRLERLKTDYPYRFVSRQPAASASSTEQNQRVPFETFILICAYQRLVGL
jgi:hypothetical protein